MKARLTSAAAWMVLAIFLSGLMPVHAIDPVELPDPVLQSRYVALIHELRCVQCLNSTLADSQVDVAAEVRREIRTMLLAGKSDEAIRDYMVSRYSEFILFKPRFSARNAWIWLAPPALLALGAGIALRVLSQRRRLLASDTEPVEDT